MLGLAQGQAPDVPLTPLGERQASDAAARLAGSGARTVWSSDLRRAVDTARPIAARLGAAVILDPDLRERSLGGFEGQPSADVLAAPGTAWADPGWRPPGGESVRDVAARVRRFLRRLHQQAAGSPVVVVTHGDTARIALAVLRGLAADGEPPWIPVANGEIITVCPHARRQPGRGSCRRGNLASRRVAEKAGFGEAGSFTGGDGTDMIRYRACLRP